MRSYEDDANATRSPDVEFSLRGITFRAKPLMPGAAFDILADVGSGKSARTNLYATFADIIRQTLIPADRERWDELMHADLDVPLKVETLAQIADDLVSNETGRPTQPLSPSTTSGESGGTNMTANSGQPADPGSPSFPLGRV